MDDLVGCSWCCSLCDCDFKTMSMFTHCLCHQLQKLETDFGIIVDSYAGMCVNASFCVGKYTLHICQAAISPFIFEMKCNFNIILTFCCNKYCKIVMLGYFLTYLMFKMLKLWQLQRQGIHILIFSVVSSDCPLKLSFNWMQHTLSTYFP